MPFADVSTWGRLQYFATTPVWVSELLFAPYKAPVCTFSTSSYLLPNTGLMQAQQDSFQPFFSQTLIYPLASAPRVPACLLHNAVLWCWWPRARAAACRSLLPGQGWRRAVHALLPQAFQLKKEDALSGKGCWDFLKELVIPGRWKRME